jgi:ribonuclease PH
MKSWQTWSAGAAVALAVAACGSTEQVTAPSVNVSIGQQLIDLKKARDSGALSPTEYERQKANLIASVK